MRFLSSCEASELNVYICIKTEYVMTSKSFETWEYEQVESCFNLKRIKNLPLLTEWINTPFETINMAKFNLSIIQERLIDNADAWNEDEFKMFFIAPLLSQMPLEIDDFS